VKPVQCRSRAARTRSARPGLLRTVRACGAGLLVPEGHRLCVRRTRTSLGRAVLLPRTMWCTPGGDRRRQHLEPAGARQDDRRQGRPAAQHLGPSGGHVARDWTLAPTRTRTRTSTRTRTRTRTRTPNPTLSSTPMPNPTPTTPAPKPSATPNPSSNPGPAPTPTPNQARGWRRIAWRVSSTSTASPPRPDGGGLGA